MICEKCGRRLEQGADVCPFCKQPVKIEEVTGEVVTNIPKLSFYGIASIAFAIIAVLISFFLGPIGASSGILLSFLGIFLSKVERNRNINCGFRWLIGFFGSIAALLVAVILLFVMLTVMAIASLLR